MTQINWEFTDNARVGGYIVTATNWNDLAGSLRSFIDQTTSAATDATPLPIGIDLLNDRVYISDPDTTTPEAANHAATVLSVVGATTLAGNLTWDSTTLSNLITSAEGFAKDDASLATGLAISNYIATVASPAGSDGYIQYKNGSVFGGEAELFWDDTNNRLGVGTTTPLEQVEIAGVNDRTALRLSGDGGSGSVTGKVYLGMHQWSSGANPSVRIGAEEISVSNYDANLVFQTRSSGSDVLPTTRMTIDHTGKVGIGTSTPSYILHVVEGSNSWQFNGSGNLVVDPGHVRAQTSGADGGIVLGQCFSTSYVGLRTNGMSETGSEYIIMSNGTNTYVSAGSGGILYLRGPANDTNPQIQIDSSVITVQESSATMMSFRYTSSSTGSGYLSFNSSTDTQIGTIGMNTNDDMRLYCHKSGGHIFFGAGNAWRWYISSSGHLLPYASAAYNLGAYYAQVDNIYIDDMATFSGSGYATCRRRDDGYVTANDGQIMELTSSERFKTDITPLTLPEAEKVLGCRPIIYRDKAEAETNPDSGFYAGISAESLQEAGYEWPLKYDKGEEGPTTIPRGIHHELIVAPLLVIVKNLKERIEALEAT